MIKLNSNQQKQLAEFSSNLGLFFIGVVIAPLFSDIKSVNLLNVLSGLNIATICVVISLFILRSIRK